MPSRVQIDVPALKNIASKLLSQGLDIRTSADTGGGGEGEVSPSPEWWTRGRNRARAPSTQKEEAEWEEIPAGKPSHPQSGPHAFFVPSWSPILFVEKVCRDRPARWPKREQL